MQPLVIQRWHECVKTRDLKLLDALLDENVVFHSPVVHTPQAGKRITTMYLSAAMHVLNDGGFHYLNQWHSPRSSVLEFANTIDGIYLNGVDMIHWNDQDRITEFKVMVRPLKAVNLLHQMMGRMLQRLDGQAG